MCFRMQDQCNRRTLSCMEWSLSTCKLLCCLLLIVTKDIKQEGTLQELEPFLSLFRHIVFVHFQAGMRLRQKCLLNSSDFGCNI